MSCDMKLTSLQMGRKSRYSQRARIARAARHCEQTFKKCDPIDFTLSVLMEGQTYAVTNRLFAENKILAPSERTFYRCQKYLEPFIVAEARASCQRARQNLSGLLSFDGSWSCCRHAFHCLVVFIDPLTKLCVDFEVVSKVPGKEGNWSGSCQGMEPEGIRVIAVRWMKDEGLRTAIKGYVHDKDSKATLVLQRLGWIMTEFIDPNHAKKSIMKSFDRLFQRPGQRKKLITDLREKVENWLGVLLHDSPEVDVRITQWLNMEQHLLGNHENCIHRQLKSPGIWSGSNDKEIMSTLKQFLQASVELLKRVNIRLTTNVNESFNYSKARVAPKIFQFPVSFEMRCAIAILKRNEGENWCRLIRNRLQIEQLPWRFQAILDQYSRKSERDKQVRNTEEGRRKVAQQRKNYRSFIYGSRLGSDELRYGELDGDATVVPASDTFFNIFKFDLCPRAFRFRDLTQEIPLSLLSSVVERYAPATGIRIQYLETTMDVVFEFHSESDCARALQSCRRCKILGRRWKCGRFAIPEEIYQESAVLFQWSGANMVMAEEYLTVFAIREKRTARSKSQTNGECSYDMIIWFDSKEDRDEFVTFRGIPSLGTIIIPDERIIPTLDDDIESPYILADSTGEASSDSDSLEEDLEITDAPVIEGDAIADDITAAEIQVLFQDLVSDSPPSGDENVLTTAAEFTSLPMIMRTPIPNIGNTCYLGTALHVLINIFAVQEQDLCASEDPVLVELNALLSDISLGRSVNVSGICNILTCREHFPAFAQNDINEFLLIILGKIDSLDESFRRSHSIAMMQTTTNRSTDGASSEIVETCVSNSEIWTEISESLTDSLDNYFGESEWYNEESGENGSISLEVMEGPRILTICIKRFRPDLTEIDDRYVDIPSRLDMCSTVYGLSGCVCHRGNLISGHYVYLQFLREHTIIYNDSDVICLEKSSNEALAMMANEGFQAYLIFYVNEETDQLR